MPSFPKRAKIAAHSLSLHGPGELGTSRELNKALELGFFRGALWGREHGRTDLIHKIDLLLGKIEGELSDQLVRAREILRALDEQPENK